jgi:hypothetical protein
MVHNESTDGCIAAAIADGVFPPQGGDTACFDASATTGFPYNPDITLRVVRSGNDFSCYYTLPGSSTFIFLGADSGNPTLPSTIPSMPTTAVMALFEDNSGGLALTTVSYTDLIFNDRPADD